MRRNVIIGTGSQALIIAEILSELSNSVDLFVDKEERHEQFLGCPVIQEVDFINSGHEPCAIYIAVGNNKIRNTIYNKYKKLED